MITTSHVPPQKAFSVDDLPYCSNEQLAYYVMDPPDMYLRTYTERARKTSAWIRENRGDLWALQELGYEVFTKYCENVDLQMIEMIRQDALAQELLRSQTEFYESSLRDMEARIGALEEGKQKVSRNSEIEITSIQSKLSEAQREVEFTNHTYTEGTQKLWRDYSEYCSKLIAILITISVGFPILLVGLSLLVSTETFYWSASASSDLIDFAFAFLVLSSIISYFVYKIVSDDRYEKTERRARQWHERNSP